MSTSYRVTGMTCQGCANSLTNAIKAVAPGAKIEVDLEAKQITVDGLDDEVAIAQAVDKAGFEFGGTVS